MADTSEDILDDKQDKYLPTGWYGRDDSWEVDNGDVDNVSLRLTKFREFAMLQAMNRFTDTPDWQVKVFDVDITSKWKQELVSIDETDFTDKMAEWCIAELQYKATIFKKTGAVSVYDGDVVKSDTAIPHSLQDELKIAIAALEEVSSQPDWHPDSDDKVLYLVDPSLYPMIYGRTRVIDDITTLDDCIEQCGNGTMSYFNPVFSSKYHWLPCEVDISAKTGVKIKSYINNLHPHRHAKLYAIIEQVIDHAIPLWNMSLTPLRSPALSYNRISFRKVTNVGEEGLKDAGEGSAEDEGKLKSAEELIKDISDDNEDDEEEGNNNSQDEDEEASGSSENKPDNDMEAILPEPDIFSPPSVPKALEARYYTPGTKSLNEVHSIDLRRDFSATGLQVTVKLVNIYLTPEKPKFEGGSWHLDGRPNDCVCTTALYYYDCVNTTTSRLAFRQRTRFEDSDETRVQNVGTVNTDQGRLITFPNTLLHRVEPFELANPEKPGHRKILALFLADPNLHVISTADVPCQQREWWGEALSTGGLRHLPAELRDQIIRDVEDLPMSLAEAKKRRLKLMKETSRLVVDQVAAKLCEH